jgi:hypothetical protein
MCFSIDSLIIAPITVAITGESQMTHDQAKDEIVAQLGKNKDL